MLIPQVITVKTPAVITRKFARMPSCGRTTRDLLFLLSAHPANDDCAGGHHRGGIDKRGHRRVKAPNDTHDCAGDEVSHAIHCAGRAIRHSSLICFWNEISRHCSLERILNRNEGPTEHEEQRDEKYLRELPPKSHGEAQRNNRPEGVPQRQ